MGHCMGTTSSFVSVVVRDIIVQGVMSRSPEAWEGRNSVNTFLNGASKESIGIYAKSRCQWSGRFIDFELGPQKYGCLKLQRP